MDRRETFTPMIFLLDNMIELQKTMQGRSQMKRILLTLMMIVHFGTIPVANAIEEGKELLRMTLKEDQKKEEMCYEKKYGKKPSFGKKRPKVNPYTIMANNESQHPILYSISTYQTSNPSSTKGESVTIAKGTLQPNEPVKIDFLLHFVPEKVTGVRVKFQREENTLVSSEGEYSGEGTLTLFKSNELN